MEKQGKAVKGSLAAEASTNLRLTEPVWFSQSSKENEREGKKKKTDWLIGRVRAWAAMQEKQGISRWTVGGSPRVEV